jgi:hypothetical protein
MFGGDAFASMEVSARKTAASLVCDEELQREEMPKGGSGI